MATLSRLTGKVFAGDADLTDLGVFGSAADNDPTNPTGTNTEAQIQADSAYEKGWTNAVVTTKNFPPVEEVNGVLRTISYQACYLLQEGIPVWDANTVYSNTSIVKVISGNQLDFYVSKREQSGNTPQTDNGTNWVKAVLTGYGRIGEPQFTLDFDHPLPDGCIDLDGQPVLINDYGALYSVYQDTYNDGTEGAGEFRLPDFTGRTIWGDFDSAGYLAPVLPAITAATLGAGGHSHSISSSGTHKHTTENAGRHRHSSRGTTKEDDGGGYFTSGTRPSGSEKGEIYTDYVDAHHHSIDTSGAHTHSTDSVGNHTHTVTISPYVSGIYGNYDTVRPPVIKVRVYTRYE